MSYIILTDSSADLPWDFYAEHNVNYLPLSVTIGNETILDNGTKDSHEFYQALRDGQVAVTSQVTTSAFQDEFEKHLKKGYDIIYLGLTQGLSGSYQSACIARGELLPNYPERRIAVIQTSCVTLGLGLLVEYACRLRDSGFDFDKLVNWLEDNKLKINHLFTVTDLMYLHRGGRVSRTSAIVGSILGIKPMLHVDHEGHLIKHGQVRGRKQAIEMMVTEMGACLDSMDVDRFTITHGDCEGEALALADMINSKFNVGSYLIRYLGPTIGAHSGPGTVALFFMGKTRIK